LAEKSRVYAGGPGIVTVLIPSLLVSRFGDEFAFQRGGSRTVGVVLMVVGVLGYLQCAWDFAAVGKGTPAPWDPPRQLVDVGLYRFMRNPIFLALFMVLTGEALFLGAPVLFAYAAFALAAFHLRIVLFEEPVLRRKFGTR
jgi:protein-S-isoprenylcysteine O-methyltransferase Ste14